MEKTRNIKVDSPVKLIFVGGFLGSGPEEQKMNNLIV